MVKTAKRTMSKALMWALSLVMVWAMIPEIGGGTAGFCRWSALYDW